MKNTNNEHTGFDSPFITVAILFCLVVLPCAFCKGINNYADSLVAPEWNQFEKLAKVGPQCPDPMDFETGGYDKVCDVITEKHNQQLENVVKARDKKLHSRSLCAFGGWYESTLVHGHWGRPYPSDEVWFYSPCFK